MRSVIFTFFIISTAMLITGCSLLQFTARPSPLQTGNNPNSKQTALSRKASPSPESTKTEVKVATTKSQNQPKALSSNLEEELYWERLSNEELIEKVEKGSDMGISINSQVEAFLNYYSGPGKKVFIRYWQRGEKYIPLVKKILREEGLPEDLAYLPILESGYWATALSPSRALGYWQFIKSTARLYGLRITPWVDERMDIEKSTRAAARYLKDLYNRFGSWELAIAAYNAGPGKVERAMNRMGSRNFWVMARSRHLKKETREYVPRFMAILLLVHNPDLYKLTTADPPPPLVYEKVKVKGMVNLKRLARLAGIRYRTLKKLNPALKKWVTPPGPPYLLKVPKGYGQKVASILSNSRYAGSLYPVPDAHGNKWIRHRLTRGESLYVLARFYGVPLSTLVAVNGITNPRLIRAGKTILIPATPRKIWLARKTRNRRPKKLIKTAQGEKVYRVQEGDSLWKVARSFSVSIQDIKRKNGLKGTKIKPGDLLIIPRPTQTARKKSRFAGKRAPTHPKRRGVITYRVKKGDNLWKIARSFSVEVRDLKRWNGLKKNLLHPGKTLVIYASSKERRKNRADRDRS